jgi:SUMO ligase MMS21 Smc5/6 complex component
MYLNMHWNESTLQQADGRWRLRSAEQIDPTSNDRRMDITYIICSHGIRCPITCHPQSNALAATKRDENADTHQTQDTEISVVPADQHYIICGSGKSWSDYVCPLRVHFAHHDKRHNKADDSTSHLPLFSSV